MARRSPVQSVHVLPNRSATEPPVTSPSEEPAWKQRAVERSIKTAKLRAAQRVQRFLDAAQAIIIEKGSTDFTVQEVVDRSRQSLRSFYLQFDGKHELLLALFEDALSRSADQIRAATSGQEEPIDAPQGGGPAAVRVVSPRPGRQAAAVHRFRAALAGVASSEVKIAHAPLLALLTELMEEASEAGSCATGINPKRMAAMTMQTVMFVAQSSGDADDGTAQPDHLRRGLGLLRPRLRRRLGENHLLLAIESHLRA